MDHSYPIPPRDMAEAMATLTDPARHGCLPSVIQSNWMFLKQARGQRVRLWRLARTAHLVARNAALPEPDATIPVTMPDGKVLAMPARTSLAADPAPTSGTGGLVDALDAARHRVIPRIRAHVGRIWGDTDPKGAA